MGIAVLERLGNDIFLRDIIREFDEECLPVEGVDNRIDDDALISLIDVYVKYPSLKHYNLIQGAWYRKHAYNLRINNPGKTITDLEVVLDWVNSEQQRSHHREYTQRYILGNPIEPENVVWASIFLKNTAEENDMSDYYSNLPKKQLL